MSGGSHHVEANDPVGKWVGVQAAVLAALLTIFTINAHRTHTDTVLQSNEASNAWAHYQAKRIRANQVEMNQGLVKLMAPNSTETAKTLNEYAEQSTKYEHDLEEIKKEAEEYVHASEKSHHQAGYFDLAEGLFEIGVILTTMYFIARRRLFPNIGLLMGIAGLVVGILGFLVH